MKQIQNTTATGWTGIIGIWLATFGDKLPVEVWAQMQTLTVEQWIALVVPILVCIRAIFVDETNGQGLS